MDKRPKSYILLAWAKSTRSGAGMTACEAMAPAERHRLRRYAIQLVGQLPEDEREALYVLFCARELVIGYLNEPAGEETSTTNVVRLVPG